MFGIWPAKIAHCRRNEPNFGSFPLSFGGTLLKIGRFPVVVRVALHRLLFWT
jgi:hypothetical protein